MVRAVLEEPRGHGGLESAERLLTNRQRCAGSTENDNCHSLVEIRHGKDSLQSPVTCRFILMAYNLFLSQLLIENEGR